MKGSSNTRRFVSAIESHLDEYDYYNFDPNVTALAKTRKGRTKKESSLYTNRPVPAGHERKIVTKYQNSEKKTKGIWQSSHIIPIDVNEIGGFKQEVI